MRKYLLKSINSHIHESVSKSINTKFTITHAGRHLNAYVSVHYKEALPNSMFALILTIDPSDCSAVGAYGGKRHGVAL